MVAESGYRSGEPKTLAVEGYRGERIKKLVLDLASPRAGERLLDVGCRDGEQLLLFHKRGCDVAGIDPSPTEVEAARSRLGQHADLRVGPLEDLPFSDDEFDLVTLTVSLERASDPGRVVAEAIRVCRGRIFIGIMNRFSLIGLQGKLLSLFRLPARERHRTLPFTTLKAIIRSQLHGVRIQWGSVLFLPWRCYPSRANLEELLPVINNPFGAFLGFSAAVHFSYRTVQQAIREPASLSTKIGGPMPGVVSRRGKHGP
ncbi:MAG: class I SAM-dependent methyltransferase [Syntrophaceae bacterium]|nr:class I SAM-dependent methyltransferase [Syntrophaceae bacterium]